MDSVRATRPRSHLERSRLRKSASFSGRDGGGRGGAPNPNPNRPRPKAFGCVLRPPHSLLPVVRDERKSRSRETALSKTDVMIPRLPLPHERYFSSLVFATVATALHRLTVHPSEET